MSAARGKPFAPGNKMGRGRPRGSRNKTGSAAQGLLDKYALNLLAKCVSMAMQGNDAAMRLLVDRLLPVLRDSTFRLKLPKVRNAADIEKAGRRIFQEIGRGAITPAAAEKVMNSLQAQMKIIETAQIEERLARVEEAVATKADQDHAPEPVTWPIQQSGTEEREEAEGR